MHLGHCKQIECAGGYKYNLMSAIPANSVLIRTSVPNPIIQPNIPLQLDELNKKIQDYYFNIEFVVRNIKKMIDFLTNYHKLYKYSIFVKDVYRRHLVKNSQFILRRDGLEDRNIEIYINCLKNIDMFFQRLKQTKISFNRNKVYSKSSEV